jgi:hypothetical protein
MKEPDIEKLNKKLAKESEGELVRLIKSKINNVKIRPRGGRSVGQSTDKFMDSYTVGITKGAKAITSLNNLNKINKSVNELKQGKDIGDNVKNIFKSTKGLAQTAQLDDRVLADAMKKKGGRTCAKKTGSKSYCGFGAMPSEKDLNKLNRGTYKDNFEIPGYQILAKSPTVIFYKKITDNTVVIAVRGSADKRDWLQTNTMLPFGRLTTTARYKEDKQFVANNLAKFAEGNDVYIVGHSLGGAIANQLQIDFPIIQGGITFNAAFQPMDFFNKSKVQRKYTSGDPLGKLGRYLPGSTVEDDSNLLDRFLPSVGLMGKSHRLDSFQSGQEGGKKVCMDKKAYVKEHKKLIKLLDKAGKEGKEQKKELESELKKGGVIETNSNILIGMTDEQIKEMANPRQPKEVSYMMARRGRLREKFRNLKGYEYTGPRPEYIPKSRKVAMKLDPSQPQEQEPKKPRNPLDFKTIFDKYGYEGEDMELYSRVQARNSIKEYPHLIYSYDWAYGDKELKDMGFTSDEKRRWYKDGKRIPGEPTPIGINAFGRPEGDLHAIIIKKKGYDKNDAVIEASKFKTSKGMFMRETKLSYRFRNIPKTKFDPKSFRSKKINKNITLVYGKLK